jgi:hypothetical protein
MGTRDTGQMASQLLRDLGFVLDPKAMEWIPLDATITSLQVRSVTMSDKVGTEATIRFRKDDLAHRLDLVMDPAQPGTQCKLRPDVDG